MKYILFVPLLLFVPVVSSAALLELNPPTGSYVAGDTIAVDVFVDTEGDSVNAISGEITYDTTQLEARSVSRVNSVIDLWVQEPSVTDTDNVVFEGIVLNPGFSGKGKVITIHFVVSEGGKGVADISFTSGLVLKNDGFGTNVLDGLVSAHFSVFEGAGPRARESLPLASEVQEDGDSLLAPTVISYTERPLRYGDFSVRGVSYSDAEVHIFLRSDAGKIEEHVVVSDSGGNFTYTHEGNKDTRQLMTANALLVLQALAQPLRRDDYTFWLTAVHEGVQTEATQPFSVSIGGFATPSVVFVGSLIILALFIILYLVYMVRNRAKDFKKEIQKQTDGLSYDIEKYESKRRQDENMDGIDVQ